MHLKKYLSVTIITIFLLSPPFAHARWANYDDAEIEYEFCNRNLNIELDGTYTETIEFQIKILKESARDHWANYRQIYNSNSRTFTIIEAKTISNDQEYPVQKELIEDKPLSSSPSGFDQDNQVLISFPNVEINSKIYLKYKTHVHKVPEFFYTGFIYGCDCFWKDSHVKVESKIPLYTEINDPDHVIDLKTSNNKNIYSVEIKLTKPIIKMVLDEPNTKINPKHLPWVSMASINDAKTLANKYIPKYHDITKEPLPKLYEGIANEAKKSNTIIDKINTVTSLLADKIRYMGDWKTIEGQFVPRKLSQVAENRLADCKDFSAATVAILNSIGIKSYVALPFRGYYDYAGPNNLDKLYFFNHAIVKVETPDNKSLWIDPTNFVSMAGKIFPDIANKTALVLNPDNPGHEEIPSVNYKTAQVINMQTWDLQDPDKIKVHGDFALKGERAFYYSGVGLKFSEDTIKHELINNLVDVNQVLDSNVILPDLKSRIVQDLEMHYELIYKNDTALTTAGLSYPIPTSNVINRLIPIKEQVSDLYIDTPTTIHRKFIIKNIKPTVAQSLDCTIETRWFDYERKYSFKETQAEVTEDIVIKTSLINNEDLKTEEYKQVVDKLLKYAVNTPNIIYTRN